MLLIAVFSACAAQAPNTGFIQEPGQLAADPELPFNEEWIEPGVDLRNYHKVHVAAVDVSYLLKTNWWQKLSEAQAFKGTKPEVQAQRVAVRFHDKIVKALESRGLQVVDEPEEGSLSIEVALVKVVPTKVWLNAIGYAAALAFDTGLTAIEGRLRDNSTGEIIGTFKDQRAGQHAPISLADLRWYSHTEHTTSAWARNIAAVASREPGQRVARQSRFTLRPW